MFEQIERQTGKPHRVLQSRPKLSHHLTPFFDAFSYCHPSRTDSGGISIAELEAYLRLTGWSEDRDLRVRALRYVKAMDDEYLKHMEKKRKAEEMARKT